MTTMTRGNHHRRNIHHHHHHRQQRQRQQKQRQNQQRFLLLRWQPRLSTAKCLASSPDDDDDDDDDGGSFVAEDDDTLQKTTPFKKRITRGTLRAVASFLLLCHAMSAFAEAASSSSSSSSCHFRSKGSTGFLFARSSSSSSLPSSSCSCSSSSSYSSFLPAPFASRRTTISISKATASGFASGDDGGHSNDDDDDDDGPLLDDDFEEEYFDGLFEEITRRKKQRERNEPDGNDVVNQLVDFIEQRVGITKNSPKKRGRSKYGLRDGNGGNDKDNGNDKDKDKDKDKDQDKNRRGENESHRTSTSTSTSTGTTLPPSENHPSEFRQNDPANAAVATIHPPSTIATTAITSPAAIMEEQPPPSVNEKRGEPYNVVCTHITADFDTLASAIGLAKLWTLGIYDEHEEEKDEDDDNVKEADENKDEDDDEDTRGKRIVDGPLPTYVVLPRGAHPDVQRFLSLHKHLFPIRSLKSLPGFSDADLKNNHHHDHDHDDRNPQSPYRGLQRVGLVDAQRRDRLGPAEILLPHAKKGVTIVDHHVDAESDIPEAVNYIVEPVGSVSTMIAERLRNAGNARRKNGGFQTKVELTEAEATLLALGIHSDTGSLVYDSTTAKDATMLGWAMEMGASQAAIAEHAKPSLSDEQQTVLTQALINVNSTTIRGVTISTVLLSADGFISGLAAVTKDALDLSSSDIFLLAVCYEATRGNRGGGGGKKGKTNGNKHGNNNNNNNNNNHDDDNGNIDGAESKQTKLSKEAEERLQKVKKSTVKALSGVEAEVPILNKSSARGGTSGSKMINSDSWKGGDVAFQRQRLAATFAFHDTDRSGFLERDEIAVALRSSGFYISQDNFDTVIDSIDENGDGHISFEEFVRFYTEMEEQNKWDKIKADIEGSFTKTPSTMTIIGRVKAGVNVRNVNLNKLFQKFNGGGHPKAASATVKLEDESEAATVLNELVEELIETGLTEQLTVGDFMQSPVLSAKPTMTEKQVEDLFIRYDVRALPVVDDDNKVIGLVSYKEVAAAKMRLTNKQEKRLRQMEKAAKQGKPLPPESDRPLESALKGWMKQHVQLATASMTMSEVENILLETDVGCMPVVTDDTKELIGMVTRTDLLRQHRYYNSLHYHNKGFSDSIAARKPIIELRKKLKKFDIENE